MYDPIYYTIDRWCVCMWVHRFTIQCPFPFPFSEVGSTYHWYEMPLPFPPDRCCSTLPSPPISLLSLHLPSPVSCLPPCLPPLPFSPIPHLSQVPPGQVHQGRHGQDQDNDDGTNRRGKQKESRHFVQVKRCCVRIYTYVGMCGCVCVLV